MVDPLDGTKDFLRRNGEFTVNIALISNREPVLGVIYIPDRQVLYFAEKGSGAFKITDVVLGDAVDWNKLLLRAVKLPLPMYREGESRAVKLHCWSAEVPLNSAWLPKEVLIFIPVFLLVWNGILQQGTSF